MSKTVKAVAISTIAIVALATGQMGGAKASPVHIQFTFNNVNDIGFLSTIGIGGPVTSLTATLTYDNAVPAFSTGIFVSDAFGALANRSQYNYQSFVVSIGGVNLSGAPSTGFDLDRIDVVDGISDGTGGSDVYDQFVVFSNSILPQVWGTLNSLNLTVGNYNQALLSGTNIPTTTVMNSLIPGGFNYLVIDGRNLSGQRVTLEAKLTSATVVPIPAALPLFAAGIGTIGFIARKRRKQQVAALNWGRCEPCVGALQ